jgi:uncharacterized protein (DUF2141 family)
MTALLVLAFLLQSPRDAAPQRQTPGGTAVIGGIATTVDGGLKRPLRRAVVSIAGSGIHGAKQTVTDESGRFVFDQLPAGRFTLTVEKPGYLKTYFGSRQPGRPPAASIAVIEGQRLLDIAIDVPKGAVVDGTVRDENGNPIVTSQVTVEQVVFVMGERRFIKAIGAADWAVTDDRGHYRFWGLPPGEYTVRASGNGPTVRILTDAEFKAAETQVQTGRAPSPGSRIAGPQLQRGQVYLPGVPDVVNAQTITLGLGEERMGVDLVNPPVASFNIDYIAIGPSGRPVAQVSMGLASLSRQSLFTSLGFYRPDAQGRGRAAGVPPGRYVFFGRGAESDEPNAPVYWVETEVDVNGADAQGVTLQFLPGQRVSGSLRSTGAALPAFGPGARAQLNPAPLIAGMRATTPTATVNPDGTFTFLNVPPGRYRFELGGVPGWTPVSAMHQSIDTLDAPLIVRPSMDVDGLAVSITNALTEISGLITDAAGRPAPELAVLVFSQDRGLWTSPRRFSGATRIASDGKYRITGLPPGNYFLAVVNDVDPLQATDPVFLEQLMTGAVSIKLADGQKVVQDLKIGG